MTKKEIIRELHKFGDVWANETYSKEYLQKHLEDAKAAREMSLEELLAHING